MEANYKWYALYTRSRWERKTAELLGKQGIEAYCPLNKVLRQWSDRKKIVLEPLFKSYIFVHIVDSDQRKVKEVPGVLSFVNYLGKPAQIRLEEIELIKRFLNDYQFVHLEKYDIRVNDKVVIRSGPLVFQKGNVIEVRNKIVKVVLPSLGYKMVAQVDKTSVELLKDDFSIVV